MVFLLQPHEGAGRAVSREEAEVSSYTVESGLNIFSCRLHQEKPLLSLHAFSYSDYFVCVKKKKTTTHCLDCTYQKGII